MCPAFLPCAPVLLVGQMRRHQLPLRNPRHIAQFHDLPPERANGDGGRSPTRSLFQT